MSATVAGALLIPGIIAGVSGSLFGGFFMQKTGKYYWITILCYSSLVVGASVVLVSAASPEFGFSNTWAIVGIGIASVISGFSNGIGVTTSLIALSGFPILLLFTPSIQSQELRLMNLHV